jgi:hypothetical protein
MRWESDDGLGVLCELDDLDKVFRLDYGFETRTWLIPTNNPLQKIMANTLALFDEPGMEDSLLIVYYGGHAAMSDDRQQMWYRYVHSLILLLPPNRVSSVNYNLRTRKLNEGSLKWSAVQELFLVELKSDVLFLLDCCAAASSATKCPTVLGTKETIGACGFEAIAPVPGGHSFTSELIEVLRRWKFREFSVGMLHCEILSNLKHHKPQPDRFGKDIESRKTPVHFITTANAQALSITLARRSGRISPTMNENRPRKRQRVSLDLSSTEISEANCSDPSASNPASPESNAGHESPKPEIADKYSIDQLNRVLPGGDLQIPHVLVSLALEGEQLLDVKAWKKWLAECPVFSKYVRIEGMYKSHSTLLTLSIPVVIWNTLSNDPACTFIGYVESINHIREESWEDNTELQSWLEISNEWYHVKTTPCWEMPEPNDNVTHDENGIKRGTVELLHTW